MSSPLDAKLCSVEEAVGLIADGTGEVVARARDFAPDLVLYDVPLAALGAVGHVAGVRGELGAVASDREHAALAALELGLADYVKKCGFERVVLGLSGGIDSALVATLAARARWRRLGTARFNPVRRHQQ